MVKWMRIALPPKIGGTLFEVTWLAGASETTCYLLSSRPAPGGQARPLAIFSRLALPPVVGVVPVTRVIIFLGNTGDFEFLTPCRPQAALKLDDLVRRTSTYQKHTHHAGQHLFHQ